MCSFTLTDEDLVLIKQMAHNYKIAGKRLLHITEKANATPPFIAGLDNIREDTIRELDSVDSLLHKLGIY